MTGPWTSTTITTYSGCTTPVTVARERNQGRGLRKTYLWTCMQESRHHHGHSRFNDVRDHRRLPTFSPTFYPYSPPPISSVHQVRSKGVCSNPIHNPTDQASRHPDQIKRAVLHDPRLPSSLALIVTTTLCIHIAKEGPLTQRGSSTRPPKRRLLTAHLTPKLAAPSTEQGVSGSEPSTAFSPNLEPTPRCY